MITWASIEARLKIWDSTVALLLSIGGFSSPCSSISGSSCVGNPIRETPNQMPPSLASHWFHFPPDHFGSYLARYDMAQEVGLKCFGGAIWTCILLHKLITLIFFYLLGHLWIYSNDVPEPNLWVWHVCLAWKPAKESSKIWRISSSSLAYLIIFPKNRCHHVSFFGGRCPASTFRFLDPAPGPVGMRGGEGGHGSIGR